MTDQDILNRLTRYKPIANSLWANRHSSIPLSDRMQISGMEAWASQPASPHSVGNTGKRVSWVLQKQETSKVGLSRSSQNILSDQPRISQNRLWQIKIIPNFWVLSPPDHSCPIITSWQLCSSAEKLWMHLIKGLKSASSRKTDFLQYCPQSSIFVGASGVAKPETTQTFQYPEVPDEEQGLHPTPVLWFHSSSWYK